MYIQFGFVLGWFFWVCHLRVKFTHWEHILHHFIKFDLAFFAKPAWPLTNARNPLAKSKVLQSIDFTWIYTCGDDLWFWYVEQQVKNMYIVHTYKVNGNFYHVKMWSFWIYIYTIANRFNVSIYQRAHPPNLNKIFHNIYILKRLEFYLLPTLILSQFPGVCPFACIQINSLIFLSITTFY